MQINLAPWDLISGSGLDFPGHTGVLGNSLIVILSGLVYVAPTLWTTKDLWLYIIMNGMYPVNQWIIICLFITA